MGSGETPPISFIPNPRMGIGSGEAPFRPNFGVEDSLDGAEIRAHQLSLLVEVNSALAGALDVEPALEKILARLADRERLNLARIYRLDQAAGELQRMASGGMNQAAPRVIGLSENNLLAWAAQRKQAAYVPRAAGDPRCRAASDHEQSFYVVPLQTRSRLLGVLEVAVLEPDAIRAVTRKLIDQIATQAALALERNELYKQLRVSEERFRSIYEQAQLGVALAALDGRYIDVNPAFAALLGLPPKDIQGKHYQELTYAPDFPGQEGQLADLLEKGSGQLNLEKRYLRKSGEPVWCATNISLLHDAAGRPAHFLAMVRNIDEQKKAEREHAHLQQQLFQAQKMEALGTLAGGIAHDFNNLLSVMLGFASLARQRLGSDDPLQESMGMIEQSAQRAADLTRQLLAFARPEKQQIKPVCVNDVLDRLRRMVARTFDRTISVALRVEKEALWVNSEPSYLEQALLNLCINARDAMPAGGVLTLEARRESLETPGPELEARPGHYVSISILDTGTGIPPETLPRIFEPFFTTKETGRGTGLGLAMVYAFVKNHDGFVKAESEPGKGARVTISLPLIPAPPAAACDSGLGQIQPGHGKVLVVDDEPLVRAFAEEGLKGLGYEVMVAENGRQALEVYEQHHGEIDCVLMDLIMPEISGLDTYRHMRAVDPTVRVVFASGYSTGEILREAPDARAAAFIGKPYTLSRLSAVLRQAVGGDVR